MDSAQGADEATRTTKGTLEYEQSEAYYLEDIPPDELIDIVEVLCANHARGNRQDLTR